jgi:hypothetical protein
MIAVHRTFNTTLSVPCSVGAGAHTVTGTATGGSHRHRGRKLEIDGYLAEREAIVSHRVGDRVGHTPPPRWGM